MQILSKINSFHFLRRTTNLRFHSLKYSFKNIVCCCLKIRKDYANLLFISYSYLIWYLTNKLSKILESVIDIILYCTYPIFEISIFWYYRDPALPFRKFLGTPLILFIVIIHIENIILGILISSLLSLHNSLYVLFQNISLLLLN